MKILWIEDFGSGLSDLALAETLFKDLLGNEPLDDMEDIHPQLQEKIKKNSLNRVYHCKSYYEWKTTFEKHLGDFDLAIIDINLESNPTAIRQRPRIKTPNFDKQAGFYIYHQLIKNGFPDKNIAFFTAEKVTLKAFEEHCGRVLLEKPQNTFEKKSNDFVKVRNWLNGRLSSEYLIFRRCVIDGCDFLIQHLKTLSSEELEKRLLHYKTSPGNRNNVDSLEVSKWDIIDHLNQLKAFFSLKEGDNRKELSLFIKFLTQYWDRNYWGFNRQKEIPKTQTKLELNFLKTGNMLMKMLRNLSSHTILPNTLSYSDAVFFFLISLRSWVHWDLKQLVEHETLATKLFNLPVIDSMSMIDLESNLRKTYNGLKQRLTNEYPLSDKIENRFFAMLDAYTKAPDYYESEVSISEEIRADIEKNAFRFLHQAFWHGLYPLYFESNNRRKVEVKFEIEGMEEDQKVIPSFQKVTFLSAFKPVEEKVSA